MFLHNWWEQTSIHNDQPSEVAYFGSAVEEIETKMVKKNYHMFNNKKL